MIAGFSLDRHRQHARRPGADGDEADVAEREHAGVADEDVERDDDRDLDERVDEVASRVDVETSVPSERRARRRAPTGAGELRERARAASHALHRAAARA